MTPTDANPPGHQQWTACTIAGQSITSLPAHLFTPRRGEGQCRRRRRPGYRPYASAPLKAEDPRPRWAKRRSAAHRDQPTRKVSPPPRKAPPGIERIDHTQHQLASRAHTRISSVQADIIPEIIQRAAGIHPPQQNEAQHVGDKIQRSQPAMRESGDRFRSVITRQGNKLRRATLAPAHSVKDQAQPVEQSNAPPGRHQCAGSQLKRLPIGDGIGNVQQPIASKQTQA